MLPLLRAPSSLKPYLHRQSRLLCSSSSPSSAKKMGERTPGQRRLSGRGGSQSVPASRSWMRREEEPCASFDFGSRSKSPHSAVLQQRRSSPGRTGSPGRSEEEAKKPFDICRSVSVGPVKLNPSLRDLNREKKKELERCKIGPQCQNLRPGMILLKNYIAHNDQVKIVQRCRELGMGVGGFYRPGYRDGAKLHLQMMCLGKNWDPESRRYEEGRPCDGAQPPKIPREFMELVEGSIQYSLGFTGQRNTFHKMEGELPTMTPDICIVNFYSSNGRLGLHQDRDESQKSLHKGLPVVSFSVGDSAEFLYGEDRDVDKADKVVLESGDVLIFGGKSRMIFHGVSTILPNTAPKPLLEETKLRPGRLNLTFRKY